MARMAISVVLLALLLAPQAAAKVITVPDDFPKIGQALSAAQQGDAIRIKTGRYQEKLALKSGITLEGADDGVVISLPYGDGTPLYISRCQNVALRNIVFEHTGTRSAKVDARKPLVRADSSTVTIERCLFSNSDGDGVLVESGSACTVSNCTFDNNNLNGICVRDRGSSCSVFSSTFTANKLCGIRFQAGTQGVVDGNTAKNNTLDGILIDSAKAAVTKNTCSGSRNGIRIYGGSQATASGNTCCINSDTGISVYSPGTRAEVTSNRCDNNNFGIMIGYGAHATATENTCTGNKSGGINVVLLNTDAHITNNTCTNNLIGVNFSRGVRGTAESNTCTGNDEGGITVRGEDTVAEIIANTCDQNQTAGISFKYGAKGTVSRNICRKNELFGIQILHVGTAPVLTGDNIIEMNGEEDIYTDTSQIVHQSFDKNEVHYLFEIEEFARLEKIATQIRERGINNNTGEWSLHTYYTCLAPDDVVNNFALRKQQIEILKRWKTAFQQSVTPRTALVKAYKDAAWDNRGSNSQAVTPQGWDREYLALAEAEAESAETDIAEKDPEFYNQWFIVGIGFRYADAKLEELFTKGVTLEKEYYPLYQSRAVSLLNRYGRRGGVEWFAEQAAERCQDVSGDAMYAYVASCVLDRAGDYNFYTRYGFDYDRIMQGYKDLNKRHPDGGNGINHRALFACLYQDREMAKQLLDELGDKWDRNIWRHEDEHNAWVAWANGEADWPAPVPDNDNVAFPEFPFEAAAWSKMIVIVGIVIIGFAFALVGISVVIVMVVLKKQRAKQNNTPDMR